MCLLTCDSNILRSLYQLHKTEYITLKKDIYDEVATKMVPDNILTQVSTRFTFKQTSVEHRIKYMIRTMDGPSELWRMRKQFATQVASSSFMTYVLCLSSRHPGRFHISRATGLIAMTELLPGEEVLKRDDSNANIRKQVFLTKFLFSPPAMSSHSVSLRICKDFWDPSSQKEFLRQVSWQSAVVSLNLRLVALIV